MPIVKAKRNPNSQTSLYGDTRTPSWNEEEYFVRLPDGSYQDRQGNPVDFNQLREDSYQNADGMQGGGLIYDDPASFERADNPAWWDEYVRGAAGGRDFADVEDFYQNPGLQQLNSDVQKTWLQKYRPQAFDKNGFLPLLKDVGGNPAGALMLGALGTGITSGMGGFEGLKSVFSNLGSDFGNMFASLDGANSAGSGLNFLAENDAITGGIGNPFGGGAAMPDFGVNSLLDMGQIAGLPGAGAAGGGSFLESLTGAGGSPFSTTASGASTVSDIAQSFESNAGSALNGGGSNQLVNALKMLGQSGALGNQGNNGIAQLLGAGSGLFDIFSNSPFSARGINEKASLTADPLMNDRGMYGDMLKNLMVNPGAFSMTPGAKFVMDTGTENLTRSNAAKGLLGSGNILADIMKFGEGVASTDYYSMIDRLGQFSGGTTGSPAAAGQIQAGNLSARNNALSNVGGGLAPTTAGGNTSGGLLQSLGGIGSGISSILGLFN